MTPNVVLNAAVCSLGGYRSWRLVAPGSVAALHCAYSIPGSSIVPCVGYTVTRQPLLPQLTMYTVFDYLIRGYYEHDTTIDTALVAI